MVLLPVAVGRMWGTFAVPDDPSCSGESDVHTPGPLRLLLELAVFFGAVAALYFADLRRAARRLLAAGCSATERRAAGVRALAARFEGRRGHGRRGRFGCLLAVNHILVACLPGPAPPCVETSGRSGSCPVRVRTPGPGRPPPSGPSSSPPTVPPVPAGVQTTGRARGGTE
ncbi:MAG: DUF2568 domain-containing protein [Streptomyces sp.]|nr:DUF2568 domain-containing protein [Streptomyces sp.]